MKNNNVQAQTAFVSDTLSKISISTDVSSVIKKAEIVIEAIVEKVEPKQELFKKLETIAPKLTKLL